MALKPANLNSALFLLGLHNFNDQEVKHAVKQNQNGDFQMQFSKDVSSCQGLKLCVWNGFKSKKCLKGSSVGRRRNTFPFACSRGLPLPELLPVFCTKLAARARRFKWNLAEQRHFMFELCALSLPHQPGWAFLWNKVNKYSQAVFCKLTPNKS